MFGPFLLFALLQQGTPFLATAGVDRDRVAVGEEFTYTVYATTDVAGSLTLLAPAFDGFELLRSDERREVGVDGARRQIWEFHLRGRSVGSHTLGPVQVVQGGVIVQAPSVDVEVVAEGIGIATQLNPRLRGLLQAATPPTDSSAAVMVLQSGERVLVGQQVDVVTAAWFPRDLRLRLRRPPSLDPPGFNGVWSYPQPVPPGIVATKRVGESWYDLFIYHQVIFPITAGQVEGTPAVLHYSVPLAFQFFSQEERFELKSAVPGVAVLPLPDEGRPAGFDGAVGSGLTLTREVEGTPRAGEPVGVRFVLSGRGNVALWPPPFLRWPAGLQVYPEGTEEKLDAVGGVLGGTKTFRYLVVPDSAGALPIPTVTYHYFDPVPVGYQVAEVAGVRIPVAPALTMAASRAEPPPLLLTQQGEPAWVLVHTIPRWGWVLVWLMLPLWWGVTLLPRSARSRAVREARVPPWIEVQHRLDRALELALHWGTTDPASLTRALREAGADAAMAERVVAVRDRLAAERFDRMGGAAPAALLGEARAIAATLEGLARRGRGTPGGIALVALIALLTVPSQAQQVPAERLYETGAHRSAMEAFSARTAAAPELVANWYGLGASAYRLGADGAAVAAWTRAARLSPRSRTLARAMLLVPAPDPATAEWRAVPPFTSDEAFLVASALWLAGWAGVLISGRWRGRWAVVVVGAVVAAGVAGWAARETALPLGILTVSTPLRVSPHGRAPGSRDLPIGTAIRPGLRRGGWVLARSATGEIGWVADAQVAWVRQ